MLVNWKKILILEKKDKPNTIYQAVKQAEKAMINGLVKTVEDLFDVKDINLKNILKSAKYLRQNIS